jgi:hypothetical protein
VAQFTAEAQLEFAIKKIIISGIHLIKCEIGGFDGRFPGIVSIGRGNNKRIGDRIALYGCVGRLRLHQGAHTTENSNVSFEFLNSIMEFASAIQDRREPH